MAFLDTVGDFYAPDRAAWRAWLAEHHRTSTGVWLIRSKPGSGEPALAYSDVVQEALCFGWIDSLPRKLDAKRSKLLFTPRKPKSAWSQANKQRVERLQASGLMAPAGLAAVQAAKTAGTWTALDAIEELAMPAILTTAFEAEPEAHAAFEAFPASARKGIFWWITSAKRPETQARRVEATVRFSASRPDGAALRAWLLRPG